MYSQSKILTALTTVLATSYAFDSMPCGQRNGHVNMELDDVIANVQDCGLIFAPGASESIKLDLKDIGTTGYLWHSHVTPENCLSIESHKIDSNTEDLGMGAAKQVEFNLSIGEDMQTGNECTVHLVQARPWLFSGFEKDGSYTKADDQKSFVIPVRILDLAQRDL